MAKEKRMRASLIGLSLVAGLLLSGCTTTGTLPNVPDVPSSWISQIQEYTAKFCKYVPTEGSITALIRAAGGTNVADLIGMARLTCDAVSKKSIRRGGRVSKPVVIINKKTIVIEGYFIR